MPTSNLHCCWEVTYFTDAAELLEAEAKSFGTNDTAKQRRELKRNFLDLSLAPTLLAHLRVELGAAEILSLVGNE